MRIGEAEQLWREGAAALADLAREPTYMHQFEGQTLGLQGRWPEAARTLEEGLAPTLSGEDAGHASTTAAWASRAHGRAGDAEAAIALADEAERLGAPDDCLTQSALRQARALALALRGQVDEAERLAREAIAILETTDAVPETADGYDDLAIVLDTAGKRDEAIETLRHAYELAVRKDDRARMRVFTERLAELGATP